MMGVSLALLLAIGVKPEAARSVLMPLNVACDRFEIEGSARICGFLAQCAHESQFFTSFKEGLFYRDPQRIANVFRSSFAGNAQEALPYVGRPEKLANRVYALRGGNGDETSGDGWRFRGRGAIQLTFRDNYRRAGDACGRPYELQPDLLLQPGDACLSAAWFWAAHGCNGQMDRNCFPLTTKIINSAMMGAKERHAIYEKALTSYH